MTQALKFTGLIVLLLWSGGQAFAATPQLSGAWRSDLGTLRLETQSGKVTGHFEGGGKCGYVPGQRVFEAVFEGSVLVGTVSLCQQGPNCREKVYPILAFFEANEGTLTAHVRVDDGCTSPALKGNKLLVLSPPSGNEGEPASSAMAVAKRNNKKKLSAESARLAEQHFTEGNRLFEQGNYRGARAEFERGLTYHETNHAAYVMLGVIQMNLDNPSAAVDAFATAASLSPNDPVPAFNLACAYARLKDRPRSLEQLRAAYRNGFGKHPQDATAMGADKDLSALLQNDPEFKDLLNKVWERSARSRRGR